jgi:hypothetical protein
VAEDHREIRVLRCGVEHERDQAVGSAVFDVKWKAHRYFIRQSCHETGGEVELTCLYLIWMRVSSFLTTSYPRRSDFGKNFGRPYHWAAILYRVDSATHQLKWPFRQS